MATITQQPRIIYHMPHQSSVYAPDDHSIVASSSSTPPRGVHRLDISSHSSAIAFDDDDEDFSPHAAATTGFFTAPPPPAHSRIDQNHPMQSPFCFFASPTLSNEDHHNKSRSNTKTLRIELAQTELVLKTGKTTVLQGVLHVNLQKNIKVKSLQLEFSGRSSVAWVDGNNDNTKHKDSCLD